MYTMSNDFCVIIQRRRWLGRDGRTGVLSPDILHSWHCAYTVIFIAGVRETVSTERPCVLKLLSKAYKLSRDGCVRLIMHTTKELRLLGTSPLYLTLIPGATLHRRVPGHVKSRQNTCM